MSKPSVEHCVCRLHVSLGIPHAGNAALTEWQSRDGRTCIVSTAGEGTVRQIGNVPLSSDKCKGE